MAKTEKVQDKPATPATLALDLVRGGIRTVESAKPTAKPKVLVQGAKAPKHRVGHTGAAWAAILPLLPTTADKLAALPELKVPQCGGPKGNGMLYVSYAIRRGWLAEKAE